jgi:hypothetical protein
MLQVMFLMSTTTTTTSTTGFSTNGIPNVADALLSYLGGGVIAQGHHSHFEFDPLLSPSYPIHSNIGHSN